MHLANFLSYGLGGSVNASLVYISLVPSSAPFVMLNINCHLAQLGTFLHILRNYGKARYQPPNIFPEFCIIATCVDAMSYLSYTIFCCWLFPDVVYDSSMFVVAELQGCSSFMPVPCKETTFCDLGEHGDQAQLTLLWEELVLHSRLVTGCGQPLVLCSLDIYNVQQTVSCSIVRF